MTESNEAYKVKIEGPDLTMEGSVPEAIGRKIMMLMVSGGEASSLPEVPNPSRKVLHRPKSSAPQVRQAGTPALSIREFLGEVEPKRNPDKVVAIGLFLKQQRSMGKFARGDLQAGFEEAAEPVPGNLSRDIKWAIKNGWIAPSSGEKGKYYVTSEGEKAIKARFSREVIKKTTAPGVRKRSGGRSKDE